MKYGKYAGLPHNRGAITLEKKKRRVEKIKRKRLALNYCEYTAWVRW